MNGRQESQSQILLYTYIYIISYLFRTFLNVVVVVGGCIACGRVKCSRAKSNNQQQQVLYRTIESSKPKANSRKGWMDG